MASDDRPADDKRHRRWLCGTEVLLPFFLRCGARTLRAASWLSLEASHAARLRVPDYGNGQPGRGRTARAPITSRAPLMAR